MNDKFEPKKRITMETLMFELKKITSGQKNLEQQLIEMKAGHASPVDDQDDGLPPLPV